MRSHRLVLAAAVSLGFSGALLHEFGSPRTLQAEPSSGSRISTLAAVPRSARATRIIADALSDAAPTTTGPRMLRVEAALDALGRHVRRQSHPDALRLALQAYYNFRAAHPEQVRKPYLYFVDYGLDSRTPRGYVFDMQALRLIDGPFPVAHGRGSTRGREGVPTRFSNTKDSAASSLGLYLAQETYAFRGTSGGRRYQSVGLRLKGLSGRFNSAARARGIVVHGAPYVTPQQAGRSEGCPAMEESRAQRLLPRISNGGLVFLFSPRDATWMREDPWSRGKAGESGAAGG